jgi:protocatechuate 3,4-dioxygenase beta subunit
MRRREMAALSAGALASAVLYACGTDGNTVAKSAVGGTTTRPDCVLTPEQEEGPFYINLAQVRQNIVENRPGVPLTLALGVVDSNTCEPIRDAAVDVWHCDALGVYSGEPSEGSEGETYLRGIQLTGGNGLAEFATIYPGQYPGRTTHIHVKVHIGGRGSGGTTPVVTSRIPASCSPPIGVTRRSSHSPPTTEIRPSSPRATRMASFRIRVAQAQC